MKFRKDRLRSNLVECFSFPHISFDAGTEIVLYPKQLSDEMKRYSPDIIIVMLRTRFGAGLRTILKAIALMLVSVLRQIKCGYLQISILKLIIERYT